MPTARKLVGRRVAAAMRAAVRTDCRKCGAAVLIGDDADSVAYRVTVDAEPVDRVHEAAAVAAGRSSYDLLPGSAGAGDLYHREPHHYLSRAQPRFPIHLQHRCEGDQA